MSRIFVELRWPPRAGNPLRQMDPPVALSEQRGRVKSNLPLINISAGLSAGGKKSIRGFMFSVVQTCLHPFYLCNPWLNAPGGPWGLRGFSASAR